MVLMPYLISQDAFYLESYARVFVAAIAKSPDREAMYDFKYLLDSSINELKLHRGYAERWGFGLEIRPGHAVKIHL